MTSTGFWWILVFTLLFGALHSLLASEGVKAWVKRRVGEKPFRAYRLGYNLVAIFTTLLLPLPVLLLPDAPLYRIPEPWIYLTLTLQALALVCLLLAFRHSEPWDFLGLAQLRGTPSDQPKASLQISGFYRCCRHPLYFFGLLFMWLFPLVSWNTLAVMLGLTVYTLLGSLLEERRLLKEYGEKYRAYQRSVPWMLPNLSKLKRD
jgi:protein-S-isoprenylcysteine O-methyltransferase Ste14